MLHYYASDLGQQTVTSAKIVSGMQVCRQCVEYDDLMVMR